MENHVCIYIHTYCILSYTYEDTDANGAYNLVRRDANTGNSYSIRLLYSGYMHIHTNTIMYMHRYTHSHLDTYLHTYIHVAYLGLDVN